VTTNDSSSWHQPIYSIGAVASMLGIDTSTLRAWEERYGVIVPARSSGGQRVYSRNELEQLRFVVDQLDGGVTPAAAHRLLADRSRDVDAPVSGDADRVRVVVLLAERDRYAVDLLEYFLRTEGYEVVVALEAASAEQLFIDVRPHLSVLELMVSGGGLELCRRLAGGGAPVLAMSALDLGDQAMAVGASAFLLKPVVPLLFVSTVRDLLGSSALTRSSKATVR
jgi:DNA-binding transcriptional MerR regulator